MSLVIPIVMLMLGSVWLRERFGLGNWVTLVAMLAGLGSCIPSVSSFAKYMLDEAKKSEEDKKL